MIRPITQQTFSPCHSNQSIIDTAYNSSQVFQWVVTVWQWDGVRGTRTLKCEPPKWETQPSINLPFPRWRVGMSRMICAVASPCATIMDKLRNCETRCSPRLTHDARVALHVTLFNGFLHLFPWWECEINFKQFSVYRVSRNMMQLWMCCVWLHLKTHLSYQLTRWWHRSSLCWQSGSAAPKWPKEEVSCWFAVNLKEPFIIF